MAGGADGSGEDVVTGRVNRAEGGTIIWADVPPDEPNFNGRAIFIAEVAKTPDDPDDYEDGQSFTPSGWLHGIIGSGSSGHVPSGGSPGGVGVIGEGGYNQGTGVVGFGGGGKDGGRVGTVPDEDQREGFGEGGNGGTGGIGVHGIGGNGGGFVAFTDGLPPGTGIVGRGGRQQADFNTARLPHGAGVIGIAGGNGRPFPPLPPLADTGSIGVWAQGADAEITSVSPPPDENGNSSGQNVPSGPLAPGAGVFGRGGVAVPPRGPVAAGVIGLAGGTSPIPDISETGDSGVYGAGPTGVFGHGPIGVRGRGESGPGVQGVGIGSNSRGGQFESTRAAQVQLFPHKMGQSTPPSVTVTPTAIVKGPEGGVRLPKDGRGGDLLTLIDDQRQCTLWFCVREGSGGPAQWAQVLLGPSFAGEG